MLTATDHVLEFVDDYLHDVLTPADAATLEGHCETCPICKVALDEARKRFAALEAAPACEAPERLIQATLERIDTHRVRQRKVRRRFVWGALAAAATVVAVLGGFHWHYANLSVTPYDLTVLTQKQMLSGSDASLRIRLMDRSTGAALAAAPVEVELRRKDAPERIQLCSFTTDSLGTGQPRFRLPDWPDGDCELRVVARTEGAVEEMTQPITLAHSWKVMLSSDKPVYQPGQAILVRALALRRPDLKPVTEAAVFSIADPKGNVIFKHATSTSRYGIASIDCPLADEILEGPYEIQCRIGDTVTKLVVEVKKYVLPKFKVQVDLDQPFYQPGQKLHGTVQADYFFGKPLANALVEVELKSVDLPASGERQPLENPKPSSLTLHTDSTGKAAFDRPLPATLIGREQDAGDARIALNVTVTDTAGQKQTHSLSRLVTNNPLKIEVIPEAGTLVWGVVNKVYLFVTSADGQPAPRANLVVHGLDREVTANDLGVAVLEITPSGKLDWTIRATDAQGRVGRRHVQLQAGTAHDDFLVRTDKAVYNGGDTLRLTALGGGSQPVFVDLLKDGQTVLTQTVDMKNGRGDLALDLPPDLFGTLELFAYRYAYSALPVRKSRVLYVRQARQLEINTLADRPEYRPGGRAALDFTLRDDQGQPTPGALSLAAVDEAVFSVLDQAPGMERTFFNLEQDLLKPVYALYPWTPDLKTSLPPDEMNSFEQGLFASAVLPSADFERAARVGRQTLWNYLGPAWVSSFGVKGQQIESVQQTGLKAVNSAWWLLAILAGLASYGALWFFVRPVRKVVFIHLAALPAVWVLFVIDCAKEAQKGPIFETAMIETKVVETPGQTVREFGNSPVWNGNVSFPPDMGGSRVLVARDATDSMRAGADRERVYSTGRDAGSTPPRLREYFPETLLWRPELITDDRGRAHLDLDLADSITSWRLTASAVSADGRLGAAQTPLKVFQPFFVDLNLPVAFTRGDEVSVPVVVYNYLDKPQTVELALAEAPWFERLGERTQKLELAAHEVRSTHYRLRFRAVGRHELQVTARAGSVADALKRSVEVVPDGRRVDHVFNGTLTHPAELAFNIPADAIEGSSKAILKIYPSSFSQLVEGLDGIFRMPYGCFEQTSSTTYPNVLALDYLKRTKKSAPDVEAKARQFIHLGYQRLLSFEVAGGGFDWFGHAPANRTLTAYGLMEFEDMARVHDVDPKLIERTRRWLTDQRNGDGSWTPESHGLHDDPTRGDQAKLSTTAYIAWAVFAGQKPDTQSRPTLDFLLAHRPETIGDPYVLALVCNALRALEASDSDAGPYFDRLEGMKHMSVDGKQAWWEQPMRSRTAFYGAGRSGAVETTSLAILALVKSGRQSQSARTALSWLISQKDASGTWHSTQATVLALKALLAGTGNPLGGDGERRIDIALGPQFRRELVIPSDQAEVMQQIDLTPFLGGGANRLTIAEKTQTAAGYQLAFRCHVPAEKPAEKAGPLTIDLAYDKKNLTVGDAVAATATVRNNLPQTAPMVMLDLPVPAGFAPVTEDLSSLAAAGTVAKFQLTPRSIIVYLRGLEPNKPLQLRYRLRATMPVKVAVPPARVYEYYNADNQGFSSAAAFAVVAAK